MLFKWTERFVIEIIYWIYWIFWGPVKGFYRKSHDASEKNPKAKSRRLKDVIWMNRKICGKLHTIDWIFWGSAKGL